MSVSLKLATLLLVISLLSGCDQNARGASLNSAANNDLIHLPQQVEITDASQAKLVIRTLGSPQRVGFKALYPDGTADEYLGAVANSGRGVMMPWIAKMNETVNSIAFRRDAELQKLLAAGKPIIISGTAESMEFRTTCGPVFSKFTPDAGKVYLVEFEFVPGGCTQNLYDISQPKQKVPLSEGEDK